MLDFYSIEAYKASISQQHPSASWLHLWWRTSLSRYGMELWLYRSCLCYYFAFLPFSSDEDA